MTVRGKEMKDVEGTIGMIGETLFLSLVPLSHCVAFCPHCVSLIILLGQSIRNRSYLTVSCGSFNQFVLGQRFLNYPQHQSNRAKTV